MTATISVATPGADGALDQRRNVMDRELHRDLVEAPRQAQHHHDGGGERIERAGYVIGRGGGGGAGAGHCWSNIWRTIPRQAGLHAALQCAQMPEISITGVFGVKPAAREAVLMVSATAAEAASPTAPHFSQIRNTTGSPLS